MSCLLSFVGAGVWLEYVFDWGQYQAWILFCGAGFNAYFRRARSAEDLPFTPSETGLAHTFIVHDFFLWTSPEACFTVNDRFCLWKIRQGSCVPGIWSFRDCLMLMGFLEDCCGVPLAQGRLLMQSGDHRVISSTPMRPAQFVSLVTQASVSWTLEKVTPSLWLSQAACASPFSAGPGLTVWRVLGLLPGLLDHQVWAAWLRGTQAGFSNLSAGKGLRPQGLPNLAVYSDRLGDRTNCLPSSFNLSVSQGWGPESSVFVVAVVS